MKSCDGCNLCCVLFPIKELNKPLNVSCKHSTKEGCDIYAKRPLICKAFICQWLIRQDMGEDLRPDKCGIVYHINDGKLFASQKSIYSHMNKANIIFMDDLKARKIPYTRQYYNEDGILEKVVYAKSPKKLVGSK